MTGLNVIVIRAAIDPEVSGCRCFSGIGVVRHIIRPQDVRPIVNFHVAAQFIQIAIFFLLLRADRGRIAVLLRSLNRTRRFRVASEDFCSADCV